jgi:hypothetical protein
MATVRLSPVEVQVDDLIYEFSVAESADAFEACVAAADVDYCQTQHAPVATRAATNLDDQVASVASVPTA